MEGISSSISLQVRKIIAYRVHTTVSQELLNVSPVLASPHPDITPPLK